jgi:hypothetical protein
MSDAFLLSLGIDQPTPTWLLVLDFCVTVLLVLDVVLRFRAWLRTKRAYVLVLVLLNLWLLLGHMIVGTIGLGLRRLDTVVCWKSSFWGFAFIPPVYIIIIFRRCMAIPDMTPAWFHDNPRFTNFGVPAIVILLNLMCLWPMYIVAFRLDEFQLQHPFIIPFTFVMWEIWSFVVVLLDTALNYYALWHVMNIKKRVNQLGTEEGQLIGVQKLWFNLAVFLLGWNVCLDILIEVTKFRFIVSFRYPGINDINLLSNLLLIHVVNILGFLLALTNLASTRPAKDYTNTAEIKPRPTRNLLASDLQESLIRKSQELTNQIPKEHGF